MIRIKKKPKVNCKELQKDFMILSKWAIKMADEVKGEEM